MDMIRWFLSFFLISLFFTDSAYSQRLEEIGTAELYRKIAQFEQNGEYEFAGDAYRLIAERDLSEIENLDRAIKNYIEAQKMYGRARDSVKLFETVADLGRLYCGSEYYLEALSLFERVLGFAERRNDTLMQARVLQQIGEIYLVKNEPEEAGKYLETASKLNLAAQDTLLAQINKLTLAAVLPDEYSSGDFPDSIKVELTKFDSIRYKAFLPSIHLHVGMYNMHVNKYNLASYYFTQGLQLASHDPFIRKELYRNLADCYEKMGELSKALTVMKYFTQYIDSLNTATKSESIQQLLLRYKAIDQDSELKQLAHDRNMTVMKSRLQGVINYALLLGVVIMLIVSYVMIRGFQQRMNANQIISQQKEEINVQKIRELENNLKIESMSSMLQGQELERERIARDLHDSLGGLLSTVKLHFDALQTSNPNIGQQKEYTKAHNLLDAACNEVRTISNNMQPGALVKLGLVPAIHDLINRLESPETPNIEFIYFGPLENLPGGVSLHIFRIIQELLYNCIKHAKANEILIQLIQNETDLEIMVEDDGQGYDVNQARKGMGTENLSARVKYLKGEISIHSEMTVGTTTTITIPLNSLSDIQVEIDDENEAMIS